MQSTQHYIDNERNFISNIGQKQSTEVIEFKTSILPMVEQIEIDFDIEKEIAQLQEANFAEKIKEIKLVEKKEEPTVELADELGSFFGAISKAKTNLTKKIEKEEAKIAGLEDLFKEIKI